MAIFRYIRGGKIVADLDRGAGDDTAIPADASLVDVQLIETLLTQAGITDEQLTAMLGLVDERTQ